MMQGCLITLLCTIVKETEHELAWVVSSTEVFSSAISGLGFL